jgi:hypothetical protein
MVKTDNDLFNMEDYSEQLAAGCDVVPVYAASKPLKAEDILPMVQTPSTTGSAASPRYTLSAPDCMMDAGAHSTLFGFLLPDRARASATDC